MFIAFLLLQVKKEDGRSGGHQIASGNNRRGSGFFLDLLMAAAAVSLSTTATVFLSGPLREISTEVRRK